MTLELARALGERFGPYTGAPLRLGSVWPPRIVVHRADEAEGLDDPERMPHLWVRSLLRETVELVVAPLDEPAVDPAGNPVGVVQVGRVRTLLPPGVTRGRPVEDALPWKGFRLPLHWDRRLCPEIERRRWVRQALVVELSTPTARRSFRWHLYLAAGSPELPRTALPHHRWVDAEGAPLRVPGVAAHWVELPAPMSAADLPPACWVQPSGGEPLTEHDAAAGPQVVDLVSTWPTEPPVPAGQEAVGWNGELGAHEPRPPTRSLAVSAAPHGTAWTAVLAAWDTREGQGSGIVPDALRIVLETPSPAVWPVVRPIEDVPRSLVDLRPARAAPSSPPDPDRLRMRPASAVEVLTSFAVRIPEGAVPVRLERGVLRLGTEVVGRWDDGPVELVPGAPRTLRCVLDPSRLRKAPEGRVRLSFAFTGRPARGVLLGVRSLAWRTEDGPHVKLSRPRRSEGGGARTPWLAVDLGNEGTTAAVGFLDGLVPRVTSVQFDDGPIYRSAVWSSLVQDGTYVLTDDPADVLPGEVLLETGLVKRGLRFGDGAHPGCPDHVAATEVARFFLKRFLVEVRDRTAWFPVAEADVVVAFPPRLAALPRFVAALRDTFRGVLEEVLWRDGAARRLVFREEPLCAAIPAVYRDVRLAPLAPGARRLYQVLDFGAGDTGVATMLLQADEDGEEHALGGIAFPRSPRRPPTGDAVTAAFYRSLRQELARVGLAAAPGEVDGRFPLPLGPVPVGRTPALALRNQGVLRALADAVKQLDPRVAGAVPLRQLAAELRAPPLRAGDGREVPLARVFAEPRLGDVSVAALHGRVLDPVGRDATRGGTVRCPACGTPKTLAAWLFSSRSALRATCGACGASFPVSAAPDGSLVVPEPRPDPGERVIRVRQGARIWTAPDGETLDRWVAERRVGADDQVSLDGVAWVPLREVGALRARLRAAEEVVVDVTQESLPDRWTRRVYPEGDPGEAEAPPDLGRELRAFLDGGRQLLEGAIAALPPGPAPDVVLIVTGRAARFAALREALPHLVPGRVVFVNDEWVRRAFGGGGQIDPGADAKTVVANGAALLALLLADPESSPLAFDLSGAALDVPVFLQAADASRPWLLAHALDLRPGRAVPLARGEPPPPEAGEPPPRPLPPDTALAGDLELAVEGLEEDRAWEPYAVVAQGAAKRKHGRRPRTTTDTALVTRDREWALAPLTLGQEVVFARILPRLPLLGEPS